MTSKPSILIKFSNFGVLGGGGGVLTVFMNDRNEGKKVEAFYIAAVFAL
jgi:hypothetical protein